MVLNEIKNQIDKSWDNKIDTQELSEALKPDWFFSDSENLAALWELLNNWDATWLDKELLNSLEQSFYSIESNIVKKEDITDEDARVLQVYITVLWEKCKEESREAQKAIDRHNVQKIMKKNTVSAKDICTLQDYNLKPYEEILDLEKRIKIEDFIEWCDIQKLMQECLKKGRINSDEQKRIDEYWMDKLWVGNNELQTREQVERSDKIKEFKSQQNKVIQTIETKYRELDPNSQNLLWELLWESWYLITNIDKFIEWDISIETTKEIKWINILNQIIQDDTYSHEKLQKKVDESVKDMMHPINEIIAKNDEEHASNPLSFYKKDQVKAIQLWANVCYGKDLPIDWNRCNYAYSLDWNENQKLTSLYIYKLEFITRKDVIEYRHNDPKTRVDNLFYISELDEEFNSLSVEDQDEILMDFLNTCYLRIRQSWVYFEDKIWCEYLEDVIYLSIRMKSSENITVEEGIRDRKNLLESLIRLNKNPELINQLQEEIYLLEHSKNKYHYMSEYYACQLKELKKDIRSQHKNNVDINHREHVRNQMSDIGKLYEKLWDNDDENVRILEEIMDKLAEMYNSKNTDKYREWMEKWEMFDSYLIKNIVSKYMTLCSKNKINQKNLDSYGVDFKSFIMKSYNEVSNDFNKYSSTGDILYQINMLESGYFKYILYVTRERWECSLTIWDDTIYWWMYIEWLVNQATKTECYDWLVFTQKDHNSPLTLCGYKRLENWDIKLTPYNERWQALWNEEKIITTTEQSHAMLAMGSATEQLHTKEMEEISDLFSDTNQFKKLQNHIDFLKQKYNNKDLETQDEGTLKKDIATLLDLVDEIPEEKLINLRNILSRMNPGVNSVYNGYEKQIQERITQINYIIDLKRWWEERQKFNDAFSNCVSNNTIWKRIKAQDIEKLLTIVWTFVVWAVLAPFTWWWSLVVALAVTAAIVTVDYVSNEIITTRENRRKTNVTITDWNWKTVVMEWYIPGKDKSSWFKRRSWQINFGQYLGEVWENYVIPLMISLATCGFSHGTGSALCSSGASQIEKNLVETTLSNMRDIIDMDYRIINWVISYFVTKKVVKDRKYWTYTLNQLMENIIAETKPSIDKYLVSLSPIMENNSKINSSGTIMKSGYGFTLKDVDPDNNTLVLQWESSSISSICAELDEAWISYEISSNWKIIKYIHDWQTIEIEVSNLPDSYRSLTDDLQSDMQNIWWVSVDEESGKITYKNPEGKHKLRELWIYLELQWWGVSIRDDWVAVVKVPAYSWITSVLVYPSA